MQESTVNDQSLVEHSIVEMFVYDDLTRLPNRRGLEQRAAQLHKEEQSYTLALLDLGGLKAVNNTLGHEVGDSLLKKFARMLERIAVCTSAFIARLGGDEFALLYPSDSPEELWRLCGKLLKRLKRPVKLEQFEVYISVGIGVSGFNRGDMSPAQLFRQADIALHNAKSSGKRKLSVYSESLEALTLRKFTLVRDIRKAIVNNWFYLEYQPRYSVKEKRVTSVEALLRWNHPVWGPVAPDEFIPVAEETGFIVELGKWVLQTACREMKPLVERYKIGLSVNVSVIQIMKKDFVREIRKVLEQAQFDPKRLEVEITETALHRSEERMQAFLAGLKAMGIGVSLDDFGKGYSSLGFIQKYAIDTVKLDKSFIRSIAEKDKNLIIFSGIVSLLRSLRMKVVAEGVESEEQLEYLQKYGCEEAQGYLFSRPVPANKLHEVIQTIFRFRRNAVIRSR